MQDHGHSQQEIRDRIANPPGRGMVRDMVYGGIDGAVTTFAIVAGVAGAGLADRRRHRAAGAEHVVPELVLAVRGVHPD